MVTKFSIPAFACALTLGLATGGYAQKVVKTQAKAHVRQLTPLTRPQKIKTSAQNSAVKNAVPLSIALPMGYVPPAPYLMNPADMFRNVAPVKVTPRKSGAFQTRAIVNKAIYRAGDFTGGANFNNTGATSTDQAFTLALSDAMDDIYLPAGIASGAGVTLTGFSVVASSINNTTTGYGRLTIYDSIDQTLPNAAVNKLAMYDFEIDNLIPGSAMIGTTGVQGSFNIDPANQIALTHDLSSTGNERYGVAVSFYTDSSRTTLSRDVGATFVYDDGVPGDSSPTIGTSLEGNFPDNNYDGTYLSGGANSSYYFGGVLANSNLFLELDGTSASNLTYNVDGFDGSDGKATLNDGGIIFSGLTAVTPKPIVFITFASTTPGVNPFYYGYSANVRTVINSKGGSRKQVGVFLAGIAADTYNVTISSPGYTPFTISNLDLTSSNYNNLSVTLIPLTGAGTSVTLETVTGSIGLENVSDLSAINAAAPLGGFEIQFRTPGTTNVVLDIVNKPLTISAGSPTGTYSISGLPDGTYDVWIKGKKNLAVLTQGVTIGSGATTIPAVTLPAGDSNNDNSVDSTDFGTLIGAFNTVAGTTSYDPTVDFNFDGSVDSTDFGILIGEFNNAGPK